MIEPVPRAGRQLNHQSWVEGLPSGAPIDLAENLACPISCPFINDGLYLLCLECLQGHFVGKQPIRETSR